MDKSSDFIEPSRNNLKILVAEDDDASYLFLKIILEKFCSYIALAKTGREAISIVEKDNDFDLILMDIKMPDINGLEASKMIKEKFPQIVIIAQSAYVFSQDIALAKDAGCDDFISKPISKNELLRMLAKYFG